MHDVKLNFCYIKGLPLKHFKESGEPLSSSFAMTWCMLATGVHRIFTKEDMKEFLFRLAITLHSKDLVENWLIKDGLMNYTVQDKAYASELEDIVMHRGFEIIDAYENYSSRDHYLINVKRMIHNAMLFGASDIFAVIKPKMTIDGKIDLAGEKYTPEITPELIAKAEFFANDLMKFIPEETFTDRSPVLLEKEKQLAERRERIKNLPVFDIAKIPTDIIRECPEKMYAVDAVKGIMDEPEDFEAFGRPMIYLAWLYANHFMESDGIFAHEIEGFSIDYEDYELEDGGINLLETINLYNLDDTIPLLRGLLL